MARMFARIAPRYDQVNDLLSFGLHRLGRRQLLSALELRPGSQVLDVCAGTGDLAWRAQRRGARPVLADGCEAMLEQARRRWRDGETEIPAPPMVVADALALPFADGAFDVAMVGFALRNVTSPLRLFEEMARVVRPGGLVACLEFTQPRGLVRWPYGAYLATVVPLIGRFLDPPAYRYLARSVAEVIDAETVAAAMAAAGLADVQVLPCVLGTMAVHLGRKKDELSDKAGD